MILVFGGEPTFGCDIFSFIEDLFEDGSDVYRGSIIEKGGFRIGFAWRMGNL